MRLLLTISFMKLIIIIDKESRKLHCYCLYVLHSLIRVYSRMQCEISFLLIILQQTNSYNDGKIYYYYLKKHA